MRWVNDGKAKYYESHLLRGRFRDRTLVAVWGGLGSRRGGWSARVRRPTKTD
jgi:hypothetical protein